MHACMLPHHSVDLREVKIALINQTVIKCAYKVVQKCTKGLQQQFTVLLL